MLVLPYLLKAQPHEGFSNTDVWVSEFSLWFTQSPPDYKPFSGVAASFSAKMLCETLSGEKCPTITTTFSRSYS